MARSIIIAIALCSLSTKTVVDTGHTRETKQADVRVVLLGAGYETVYTGDRDTPAARRLGVTFLVEPLTDPPALTIGPVELLSSGSEQPVKVITTGSKKFATTVPFDGYNRVDHFVMPEVANPDQTMIYELTIGPVVAEPKRIDLKVNAGNGQRSATFLFEGIRVK